MHRIRPRLSFVVSAMLAVLGVSPTFAQDLAMVPAPAGAGVSLRGLRLPDVRINEVADVRDSTQRTDNVRVPHCRVTGVIGKGTRFGARKGKLILWHGWADPALNPLATIEYYEKVLAADSGAREYVRLFLEPGVLHCAGGAGPSDVAWLRAMTDWVERAQTPQQVIASKRDSTGKVTRSRPLCTYPQRAVYTGQGSTDDAINFVCKESR